MTTFTQLKENIEKHTKNFDTLTEYISKPDVIRKCDKYIKEAPSRYYFTAWVLYHFPDISMNKNFDQSLYDLAKKVRFATDHELDILPEFKKAFDAWKEKDKQILSESIFMQYHNSGVDLLNATNDDDKKIITEIRNELLRVAKTVGGEDLQKEIQSYKPVVVNIEELGTQFNDAFWDSLKEGYDTGNYNLFIQVMSYIRDIFTTIRQTRRDYIHQTIDIEYLSRIMVSKGRDEYVLALVMNIFDFIEENQAPIRDIRLKRVRDMIGEEDKRIDIIRGIVELTEQMVIDINNNHLYNK